MLAAAPATSNASQRPPAYSYSCRRGEGAATSHGQQHQQQQQRQQRQQMMPLQAVASAMLLLVASSGCISPAAAAPEQGIRLVGAGLPCTGTQSLVVALNKLGYKSCHGIFFWLNTTMRSRWTSYALEGGPLEPALETLLEQGYDATLDVPTVYGWEDLASRYPESKVILTVRDSPEKWYKSFASKLHFPTGFIEFSMRYVGWYYNLDVDGFWTFLDRNQEKIGCNFRKNQTEELKASCIQGYIDHNAKVQATIPSDRLLVFNLKQGWKPLCDFLGVPVPDIPFPQRDITKGITSDVFTDMMDPILSMNFRPFLWFMPLHFLNFYLLYRLCRCCLRRCCCRGGSKKAASEKKDS
mmetsp:Transcript_56815/g.124256  ORF Transcript_56815/g.124256 Transcript_56815/m.124256 type:complete len:354 (-) Transcript_56815:84-1145(-)